MVEPIFILFYTSNITKKKNSLELNLLDGSILLLTKIVFNYKQRQYVYDGRIQIQAQFPGNQNSLKKHGKCGIYEEAEFT